SDTAVGKLTPYFQAFDRWSPCSKSLQSAYLGCARDPHQRCSGSDSSNFG
ncbi:hpp family protein, partial [Moniliophthora roreri]